MLARFESSCCRYNDIHAGGGFRPRVISSRATSPDYSRAVRLQFPQPLDRRRLEFGGQRDGHAFGDVMLSGPRGGQPQFDSKPGDEQFSADPVHHLASPAPGGRRRLGGPIRPGAGHDAGLTSALRDH